MHIEPGVVDGTKMILAYGTATAAAGYSLKLIYNDLKIHSVASFGIRTFISLVGVFIFFEILPHFAVGISEVHIILGTSLFLLFGSGPAALGLAGGLAIQGLMFEPSDLPMYFVNISTLLFPLFSLEALVKKVIPPTTAYIDLKYMDVLKMSAMYQGCVVAWVLFWTIYGQGLSIENLLTVTSFGTAYLVVIMIEPVVDLAVLASAKGLQVLTERGMFTQRLHNSTI